MMGDWEIVTDKKYKNKKYGGKTKPGKTSIDTLKIYENDETSKHCESNLTPKDILKHFDKLDKLTDEIITSIKPSHKNIQRVYSWGAGSLEISVKSRVQMAFSILLAQKLGVSCFCYDPAFTDSDKSCINKIDQCEVTGDNNECGVEFENNKETLVVGIHLFKKHYQNLIVKNGGELKNIVLIGNRISSMVENHALDFDISGLKSVLDKESVVFDVGSEWVRENKRSQDTDVFNDTVATIFSDNL
jgi:hypothetical protein